MKARETWLAIAGMTVVILLACATTTGARPERTPNFVVVLCDDLGYGDLGCYGHPAIRTPNLDRFAAEGLRLTHCYASAPVCSPSRAGMLTGRTPYRLGIRDWIAAESPVHLRPSEITVAKLLKGAGYATAHVGKWHCNGKFNSPEQPQPGDHGFDHWFSTQNNAAPSHRNPENFVRNGRPAGKLEGYSSGLIVDEALGWLKGRDRAKPFCLFVWFHSPHEPVATDEKYTALYPNAEKPEQAIYFGNVTEMDAEFGRLMRSLDEMDLRRDTLVHFTSDNGPEYRARHSFGSAGSLRGKKLFMYEGGIRVPGMVRWPGHAQPGQISDEPVINLDVLPTFCEIAGLRVPFDRAIDGASILPLFHRRKIDRKTPLYWQYDLAHGGPTLALRQGDWKILAFPGLVRFELFNLRQDPAEVNDLAATEPQRLKRLGELLRLRLEHVRSGAAARSTALQ